MTGSHAVVGEVGKAFGVRGEVTVRLDPDLDVDLPAGRELCTDAGDRLVVASARWHGQRRLVGFEGVDDREGAEALRGAQLLVPREEVPVPEGARWVDEILGAEVVDASGEPIGVLERVEDGAAHDLLVVARPDGGEILVPAVEELVDFSGERVVIQPLPGLVEPEDADEARPDDTGPQ